MRWHCCYPCFADGETKKAKQFPEGHAMTCKGGACQPQSKLGLSTPGLWHPFFFFKINKVNFPLKVVKTVLKSHTIFKTRSIMVYVFFHVNKF